MKRSLLSSVCILLLVAIVLLLVLIISPFVFLVTRIICWFFADRCSMRNKNGELQTPIIFYQHPVTQRVVVFLGMIHIGESAYYKKIQDVIDSLDYHTLFEGVGEFSLQEEQCLTPNEKDMKVQLDFISRVVKKISHIMSLQYQRDGLLYSSSWVNTDLRLRDLIRLFVQDNICIVNTKHLLDIDEFFENDAVQAFIRWFVNHVFGHITIFEIGAFLADSLFKNRRKMNRILLDKRNEVALQGINKYLEYGNIVTIWGAGHLSGIQKGLQLAGFREIDRRWISAYTIGNISFFKLFRDLLNSNVILFEEKQ